MSHMESLVSLAFVFILACCSPGPVFLLIASIAAGQSRSAGLKVGLGVATATCAWATLAVFGLTTLLASVAWVQTVLRYVAGGYLIWLGFTMLRQKKHKAPVRMPSHTNGPFLRGFLTSMTNPKALAFFGSALAVTAPSEVTVGYQLGAIAMLTLLSAVWHGFLAIAFATGKVAQGYLSAKALIDRSVGAFLAVLGLSMLIQPTIGRLQR